MTTILTVNIAESDLCEVEDFKQLQSVAAAFSHHQLGFCLGTGYGIKQLKHQHVGNYNLCLHIINSDL